MEGNLPLQPGPWRRTLNYVRRLRPSPGMIVALVALFVALGGTAAARDSGSTKVLGADVVTVVRVSGVVQPHGYGQREAMCPRGYDATGGGIQHYHDFRSLHSHNWQTIDFGPRIPGDQVGGYFQEPGLRTAPRGWGAFMRNLGPESGRFAISVVCARVAVDHR